MALIQFYVVGKNQPITKIEPSNLIVWAVCIGVAWLILISLTGLDDWLKSLFGRKRQFDNLEARVGNLERRLDELGKK